MENLKNQEIDYQRKRALEEVAQHKARLKTVLIQVKNYYSNMMQITSDQDKIYRVQLIIDQIDHILSRFYTQ